jgi:hypothetical protein
VNREPGFDELIGPEPTGAEREQLRRAHELLLQAGPPPELTPRLETAQAPGVVRLRPRRQVTRRMTLLLAAALAAGAVFAAGYAVADHRGGSSIHAAARTLFLHGTATVPGAQAKLEVWHARAGNWPMTLTVDGLPKLPAHTFYEVYLVRNGKPWGSCGTFRVANSSPVTLTLNAPYALHKGDSWVVTRQAAGREPGRTVLTPA